MSEPIRILIVDDDPAIQRSLTRTLEGDGVQVFTSGCAAEAFVYLKHERIDLIVSDYKMPGACGLDFLEKAKRQYQNLECILLTGEVADLREARQWADQIGVAAVLPKPCDSDRLIRAIQEVLA